MAAAGWRRVRRGGPGDGAVRRGRGGVGRRDSPRSRSGEGEAMGRGGDRVSGVGGLPAVGGWIREARLGRGAAGPACWAEAQWGGASLLFLPLFFCFLFCSFSFYLFSFTVLIQLMAYKYFINLCFLYYNYLCNIWH